MRSSSQGYRNYNTNNNDSRRPNSFVGGGGGTGGSRPGSRSGSNSRGAVASHVPRPVQTSSLRRELGCFDVGAVLVPKVSRGDVPTWGRTPPVVGGGSSKPATAAAVVPATTSASNVAPGIRSPRTAGTGTSNTPGTVAARFRDVKIPGVTAGVDDPTSFPPLVQQKSQPQPITSSDTSFPPLVKQAQSQLQPPSVATNNPAAAAAPKQQLSASATTTSDLESKEVAKSTPTSYSRHHVEDQYKADKEASVESHRYRDDRTQFRQEANDNAVSQRPGFSDRTARGVERETQVEKEPVVPAIASKSDYSDRVTAAKAVDMEKDTTSHQPQSIESATKVDETNTSSTTKLSTSKKSWAAMSEDSSDDGNDDVSDAPDGDRGENTKEKEASSTTDVVTDRGEEKKEEQQTSRQPIAAPLPPPRVFETPSPDDAVTQEEKERRRKSLALEQQQMILRQVQATRDSRQNANSISSYNERKTLATKPHYEERQPKPQRPFQNGPREPRYDFHSSNGNTKPSVENEQHDEEIPKHKEQLVERQKDDVTPNIEVVENREDAVPEWTRPKRGPRTQGRLFYRLPDGTLREVRSDKAHPPTETVGDGDDDNDKSSKSQDDDKSNQNVLATTGGSKSSAAANLRNSNDSSKMDSTICQQEAAKPQDAVIQLVPPMPPKPVTNAWLSKPAFLISKLENKPADAVVERETNASVDRKDDKISSSNMHESSVEATSKPATFSTNTRPENKRGKKQHKTAPIVDLW